MTEDAMSNDAVSERESSLREALPGWVPIDRHLELEGAYDADFVGIDGAGRLVLVLFARAAGQESRGRRAKTSDDELVLATLDALAWARDNVELLARHLSEPRLSPAKPPLVVVVASELPAQVVARLAPLTPDPVRLLLERELRSDRIATTFLCPVGEGREVEESDPRTFLERLDEELAHVAELVVQRLEHVDEQVTVHTVDGGLSWTFRGEFLCSLEEVGGHLEGRFGGESSTTPFRSDTDVEAFLDQALALYVDLAQLAEVGPPLDEVELVPPGPPPLLSADEIQAFGK